MLKNIKKEMLRIIECKKLKPYGSLNSETNKSTSYFRPTGKSTFRPILWQNLILFRGRYNSGLFL